MVIFGDNIDHGDLDQLKRQKTAQGIKCDQMIVNTGSMSGHFQGSHGEYNTTLESCECVDFIMRGKPCKHMYRLANELGIFDSAPFISVYEQIEKARKKIEIIIKQMSLDELKSVQAFLRTQQKK